MSGSCCESSTKSEPIKDTMAAATQATNAPAELLAAKSDKNECCDEKPAKSEKRSCCSCC